MYTTLQAVRLVHDKTVNSVLQGESPVTKAARALFNQGVTRLYAVSVTCSSTRAPTNTEIRTALASLAPYAVEGKFDGVILAGITTASATLVSELNSFANSNNVVYATTHAAGETVSNIVNQAAALPSGNGIYVAHASTAASFVADSVHSGEAVGTLIAAQTTAFTSEFPHKTGATIVVKVDGTAVASDDYTVTGAIGQITFDTAPGAGKVVTCDYTASLPIDDVAASVMGATMAIKPWNTLFWRAVNTPISTYFTPADMSTLETAKVNCIHLISSSNRISNGLTLGGSPKYVDVTRTRYYTALKIRDSVAALRLNQMKIPYTKAGIDMVESAIKQPLEALIREDAISTYTVVMPVYANIAAEDRANRVLNGVNVTCQLSGDIQTFNLYLTIAV